MIDKNRETYREEATELLAELESALLDLEETPNDQELIGRVFRALHTIKGSGAMFGFDRIAAFTHEVETVFDQVRAGRHPLTSELADRTLMACDLIKQMIGNESVDDALEAELTAGFKACLKSTAPAAAQAAMETDATGMRETTPQAIADSSPAAGAAPGSEPTRIPETLGNEEETTFRIRFRPTPDIFKNGTNPLLLLEELRQMGTCEVVGLTKGVPELTELNPESCYLAWDVILTTRKDQNAVRDVFIFVEDQCRLEIEAIHRGGQDLEDKRLGDILLVRGDLETDALRRFEKERRRFGEGLVASQMVDEEQLQSALTEQEHVRRIQKKQQESTVAASIRVSAEKLDQLVDLVGELVTVQARLTQKAAGQSDPEIRAIAEVVERLTSELRDKTMNIRMLPIGSTFNTFKRLARDLSHELGKDIVLTTAGGETELDKTIIERLNDPLVHILRNSIGHGVETPAERIAKGKPARGRVHLWAEHSGAHVLVRVRDDGRGLDRDQIRAAAEAAGLMAKDVQATDKEIFAHIFSPGITTSKTVTDLSGRGVGLDVVKRRIDALRGAIEVESSRDVGTTITLKLPLTLAIIDGLLVTIDDTDFILPLQAVAECVELNHAARAEIRARHQIEKESGDAAETLNEISNSRRRLANVRGELVPYICLRELFAIETPKPPIQKIVITQHQDTRVGFVVDEVIGQHQTVLKSLGHAYRRTQGFAGASVLADGTVALVLDLNHLSAMGEAAEHAMIEGV